MTAVIDLGDDALLTPKQTGEILGVAAKTLERWRSEDLGVPWVRIGRRVAYRVGDVRVWIRSQRCGVKPPAVEVSPEAVT